jgi:hypothetical protein
MYHFDYLQSLMLVNDSKIMLMETTLFSCIFLENRELSLVHYRVPYTFIMIISYSEILILNIRFAL